MNHMRHLYSQRTLVSFLLIVIGGFISSCAGISGTTNPEDIVSLRAQERWNAAIKGDLERAYGYLTPSYRQAVSYKAYLGVLGSAVQWLGAEVNDVRCPSSEKCEVIMNITYKPLVLIHQKEPMVSQLQEVWLKEDGWWWLLQKQ